jgi:hypothetical protein
MALREEIEVARRRIYRDGYDMSLGELANLYQRGELTIQPEYQRLFRWDPTRKTRFIESLLLNIPIPPIFVFSGEGGRWELIDGLQRISTVLEFMGDLVDAENQAVGPFIPNGTDLLPSLQGKRWPQVGDEPGDHDLEEAHQLSIRRARIRIEILGQETDPEIKFELFQRLNTGGANLSEQEIRNCIIVSINRQAYHHLHEMATNPDFIALATVGEERAKRQFAVELAVRFVVLRNYPYRPGLDVHNYLDKGIVTIASNAEFDWDREKQIFVTTMRRLHEEVGVDAFRKNNRWSLALYEFISLGVSRAIEGGVGVQTPEALAAKVAAVGQHPEVERYSGSGIRGTQRLSGLVLPFAQEHFAAP